MKTQTPVNPETKFDRSAWLILSIVIALLVFSLVYLAYRFTLPTDGWEVSEASDLPELIYTQNLMGFPSGLQPGDRVNAVAGVPADWRTMPLSPLIQESWRVGATLDYTVSRAGQEIHVPVTLGRWQIAKWLLVTLRDPSMLASLLSDYILLALAAFVFLRQPGNPASGAFLLIMAILAQGNTSNSLPGGFTVWIDPVANILGDVNLGTLTALFPFALIRFALVFPHPKPIQQRHPWLSYAVLAVGLPLNVFTWDSPIGWFWFVVSIFLGVAILIHNAFTMRDAVSQAQLRWGLGGFIIGFGTLALLFLAGTLGLPNILNIFSLISSLAITVMGGMLAMAIFRYRLFDIDIIIRRTLVYTVLTAMLALVYFGMVILLERVLQFLVGGGGQITTVISTLTIAALFTPLRRRVQDFIDRRFYRRKYNAQQALAQFAAAARDETDLEALTARVVGIVQDTMQPELVSLWLQPTASQRQSLLDRGQIGPQ